MIFIKFILILNINYKKKMCYLCFIYIFFLDFECFKIKLKVDIVVDILVFLI